jgi:hypothetical protein
MEGRGFMLGERDGCDPGALETDVDSGGIFQGGREVLIQVSTADGERQQSVVLGLDLGGEHPRGRGGCGGRVGSGREQGDGETPLRSGARTGGADDAATDHGDLRG